METLTVAETKCEDVVTSAEITVMQTTYVVKCWRTEQPPASMEALLSRYPGHQKLMKSSQNFLFVFLVRKGL